MVIRFFEDDETHEPHIYKHGITKEEARQIVKHSIEERRGTNDSIVAIGITSGGRYLKVIFTREQGLIEEDIFVITGWVLPPKQKRAFRRRRRGRGI